MKHLLFIMITACSALAAPVNTNCPMMPDETITDTEHVVEFNGQEVAFCCARCIRKWNALDDAGRTAKLAALAPSRPEPRQLPATNRPKPPVAPENALVRMNQLDPLGICPKSGGDAAAMGKATRRVINGIDVTFCCPPCIEPYEENHDEYRAQVSARIIEQQKPYYPTDRCLISGRPLGDDAIDHVQGNRLFRLCCNGCAEKVDADPALYGERLDFAIAEAQRGTYPLKGCIVADSDFEEGTKPTEVIVGNRLMLLCCDGCKGAIREKPYVFVAKVNTAWESAGDAAEGTP